MLAATTKERTAIVTGVAGQDGMYLSRLLVRRGWKVVGTVRPGISSIARMGPYLGDVEVVEHDLLDAEGFARLLSRYAPDVVFNLAGFSSVGRSWTDPVLVARTNHIAVVEMLDSILQYRDKNARDIRYFQASSAEVFGGEVSGSLGESTSHWPRTPYAVSKSAAHHAVASHRERHGLHASNGILFNHESPFRGQQFVAGKIARTAAEVACGLGGRVVLGDIDVRRDWGAAVDYVEAMAATVDHDSGSDYVIATGESHTLRDMLEVAFGHVGADAGDHLELDPQMWPAATQADELTGDPTKAAETLGWRASTSFEDLVRSMVDVEVRRIRSGVEESVDYLQA